MGKFKDFITNKTYSEEYLLKLISNSCSFKELFLKLKLAGGPTDYKEVKEFCEKHNFDVKLLNWNEQRKVTRTCLTCGKTLKKGQYKFCSCSCAAKFNNQKRKKNKPHIPPKKLPEYNKLTKEQLEHLLIDEHLSFNYIGKLYKTTYKTIQKLAKKLNVDLTNYKPHKFIIKKELKKCLNCGKEVKSRGAIFCSKNCCNEYHKKEKYKNYLEHQEEFLNEEINYGWLKPIILEEQGNVCAICHNEPIWNGKELHLIMDHIDGNACNNSRENLRMICPNCDSQLDTYKSRNKGKCTRKYVPYKKGKLDK